MRRRFDRRRRASILKKTEEVFNEEAIRPQKKSKYLKEG